MSAKNTSNKLDKRDEMILIILAVMIPLATLPAMLGL